MTKKVQQSCQDHVFQTYTGKNSNVSVNRNPSLSSHPLDGIELSNDHVKMLFKNSDSAQYSVRYTVACI